MVLPSTAAFAQTETTTTTTPMTFMDDTGFTMRLPPGWIGYDYDNNEASAIDTEDKLGYTKLATFCPQEDAVPKLGSEGLTCNVGSHTSDWITVFRYKDLASKPEFAPIIQSGRQITANDVYLYHLEEIRNFDKASNPNNPQFWEPMLYEEYTEENVPVKRNAAGGPELALSPLNGKVAMTAETGYSLFFIDDSTGYAYRVSSNGFTIKYWWAEDSCVLECSAIVPSIHTLGINPNVQAEPHPVLPYNPPTVFDYNDPGAVILIPPETLAAQASSSEDPSGLGLFG
jgi:hypothetical protein